VDCIFARRNENELTYDNKDDGFQCVCVCVNECCQIAGALLMRCCVRGSVSVQLMRRFG
jgi:hypothetical protein